MFEMKHHENLPFIMIVIASTVEWIKQYLNCFAFISPSLCQCLCYVLFALSLCLFFICQFTDMISDREQRFQLQIFFFSVDFSNMPYFAAYFLNKNFAEIVSRKAKNSSRFSLHLKVFALVKITRMYSKQFLAGILYYAQNSSKDRITVSPALCNIPVNNSIFTFCHFVGFLLMFVNRHTDI